MDTNTIKRLQNRLSTRRTSTIRDFDINRLQSLDESPDENDILPQRRASRISPTHDSFLRQKHNMNSNFQRFKASPNQDDMDTVGDLESFPRSVVKRRYTVGNLTLPMLAGEQNVAKNDDDQLKALVSAIINEVPETVGTNGKSLRMVVSRVQGSPDLQVHNSFRDSFNERLLRGQRLRRGSVDSNVRFSLPIIANTKRLIGQFRSKRRSKLPVICDDEVPPEDTPKKEARLAVKLSAEGVFSTMKCYDDIIYEDMRSSFPYLHSNKEPTGVCLSRIKLPVEIKKKPQLVTLVSEKDQDEDDKPNKFSSDKRRKSYSVTTKKEESRSYDNSQTGFYHLNETDEQSKFNNQNFQHKSGDVKSTNLQHDINVSNSINVENTKRSTQTETETESDKTSSKLSKMELSINHKVNQAVDIVDYFKHKKGDLVTSQRFNRPGFNPVIHYPVWNATWRKLFKST